MCFLLPRKPRSYLKFTDHCPPHLSGFQHWNKFLQEGEIKRFEEEILLCWTLWLARNKRHFSNTQFTPLIAATLFCNYLDAGYCNTICRTNPQIAFPAPHSGLQCTQQNGVTPSCCIYIDGACKEQMGAGPAT